MRAADPAAAQFSLGRERRASFGRRIRAIPLAHRAECRSSCTANSPEFLRGCRKFAIDVG